MCNAIFVLYAFAQHKAQRQWRAVWLYREGDTYRNTLTVDGPGLICGQAFNLTSVGIYVLGNDRQCSSSVLIQFMWFQRADISVHCYSIFVFVQVSCTVNPAFLCMFFQLSETVTVKLEFDWFSFDYMIDKWCQVERFCNTWRRYMLPHIIMIHRYICLVRLKQFMCAMWK